MTMKKPAQEKVQNTAEKKEKQAPKKRRKRARGVPAALVAVLLVLALFFGGLFGFIIANKTSKHAAQLAEAEARIASLENYLTMIGFSEEESDPENWIFDDSGEVDEFGDLSGAEYEDGTEALWGEEALLDGMLTLEGDPVVVAEFEGGSVMSDEVVEPYNEALATQMFNLGDGTAAGDVLDEVLQTLVADKVLYTRASELGLTELTAEDLADIEADAQAFYAEQKDFYAPSVNTAGMSPEQADAAIDAYMETEVGVTVAGLIEEQKSEYWIQKLYDHVGKDITVTAEEVQAAYDAMLADQKELFTAYPEEYEYAMMSGQTIVYNLENYRRVKHVMLAFDTNDQAEQAEELMDQIAMLDPETQMDQIQALQEQLDALYTDLEAKAQTVLDEINAGADFDAMIDKYGMDDGMNYEPAKSNGYYVSSDSIQWSPDFVEGSMMLEEIGQVSTPVRSVSGIHIIKYIGDVTPGEVDLPDVSRQIQEEVFAEKQELAYETQIESWLSTANATYYPERLQ